MLQMKRLILTLVLLIGGTAAAHSGSYVPYLGQGDPCGILGGASDAVPHTGAAPCTDDPDTNLGFDQMATGSATASDHSSCGGVDPTLGELNAVDALACATAANAARVDRTSVTGTVQEEYGDYIPYLGGFGDPYGLTLSN
jgi:hypothetical protein